MCLSSRYIRYGVRRITLSLIKAASSRRSAQKPQRPCRLRGTYAMASLFIASFLLGRANPARQRTERRLDSYVRATLLTARMSLRERTRPGLGIIEPCLPSPAKAPPSGPGWLHEIKHDGFRILARRDSAGVRLITRNGNEFSHRFPFIAMALAKLGSLLLDRRRGNRLR
jgi:hypothetical protein